MQATAYPSLLLMEQAAQQVLQQCKFIVQPKASFAILCGKGNNGGDAYALARLLLREGHVCNVYAVGDPKTTDAQTMRQLLCNIYGTVVQDISQLDMEGLDYIVDGLFGIGFAGTMEYALAKQVHSINHSNIPVLSIDLPSGLNGRTGYAEGACLRAQHTFTFHRPKHGHYLSQAKEYVGKLHVLDIGIAPAFDEVEGIEIMSREEAKELLQAPPCIAHKGDMGKALLFAGSQNLAGAAALLAKGARALGAGLITLASEPSCVSLVQSLEPTVMGLVLEREEDVQNFLSAIEKSDALAMGPGLAPTEENYFLLAKAIKKAKERALPTVLDAEALRYLAKNPQRLSTNFLLTPHPGEAADLLHCSIEQILQDYQKAAQALFERYGACVLLKGVRSLLYDGKRFVLADSGSPSLAKGGSGDALAGILVSLFSKRYLNATLIEKACLASYLLGYGGELAEQTIGSYSGTAKDALEAIALTLSKGM